MDQDEVQKAITAQAQQTETEQISDYLGDWFKRRIPGAQVAITRFDAFAWFAIEVEIRDTSGNIHVARTNVRDEDIDEFSDTTSRWSMFLDRQVGVVLKEFSDAGVKGIEGMRPGLSFELNQLGQSAKRMGSAFETTGVQAQQFQRRMSFLSQAQYAQDRALAEEERMAIESIKRTIAGQVE